MKMKNLWSLGLLALTTSSMILSTSCAVKSSEPDPQFVVKPGNAKQGQLKTGRESVSAPNRIELNPVTEKDWSGTFDYVSETDESLVINEIRATPTGCAADQPSVSYALTSVTADGTIHFDMLLKEMPFRVVAKRQYQLSISMTELQGCTSMVLEFAVKKENESQ